MDQAASTEPTPDVAEPSAQRPLPSIERTPEPCQVVQAGAGDIDEPLPIGESIRAVRENIEWWIEIDPADGVAEGRFFRVPSGMATRSATPGVGLQDSVREVVIGGPSGRLEALAAADVTQILAGVNANGSAFVYFVRSARTDAWVYFTSCSATIREQASSIGGIYNPTVQTVTKST